MRIRPSPKVPSRNRPSKRLVHQASLVRASSASNMPLASDSADSREKAGCDERALNPHPPGGWSSTITPGRRAARLFQGRSLRTLIFRPRFPHLESNA